MIVHPRLAQERFSRALHALLETPACFATTGIHLIEYSFPFLYVGLDMPARGQRLRLRVDGSDYDYRPIDGRWVDSQNQIIRAGSGLIPSSAGFHAEPMEGWDGPWFCFLGWKSWHNHSGHQDTPWQAIRGLPDYSPSALIRQLHADLNRPGVQFQ